MYGLLVELLTIYLHNLDGYSLLGMTISRAKGEVTMKLTTVFSVLFISIWTQAKPLISITAVGDIMMGSTYPVNALPENEGVDLFKPAREWIVASDVRFGNFEGTFFDGPIQDDGKRPGPNRWAFKTPTTYISRLSDAGFNVVSLANNHVKDFGLKGMESTKKTLTEANIQFSSKTGEVAKFKVDETEISLIAIDFYKAPRSMTEPYDTYVEIRKLKERNNIVIVSVHAGGEGRGAENVKKGTEIFLGENRGDSIAFAHTAIDEGADVVIMHGPHVPRGIELYKDRIIAYSLGNFMTGKGVSLEGYSKLAPLLRVQIDQSGQFQQGQIVSFTQKRNPQRIELDLQHGAMHLIRNLSKAQFPASALVFEEDGRFQ